MWCNVVPEGMVYGTLLHLYVEHRSVCQWISNEKGEIVASTEGKSENRTLRSDARQNEDALLQAAKQIFLTAGVDVPVREIADKAGVGVATLYRRFPKRSDLIAAVFRNEIEACVKTAKQLAQEHKPADAVELWLKEYSAFMMTKKGLSAALHSGDPAYADLPDYFRSQFEPVLADLLSKAAKQGDMSADIDAFDLLRAIGNLTMAGGGDGERHVARMVDLLVRGLRKA